MVVLRRRLPTVLTITALAFVSVVVAAFPVGAVDDAAGYEVFTGSVEDFYHLPDPLPPGAPGDLIRVQAVGSNADSTTVRIMYHSVDGAGRDRAVTGKLTFPGGPRPAEGLPVMSIANGTVGLAPGCALSRNADPVYDFGIGGVAVASDYIGEGPVGELQAYMSRVSEGHSVLDAVRAARNYADAGAGSRFVVLGGSQGGHGALAASELAASWTPELDLAGTVSLAPAAMFDRTYGALDEIVTRVVTAMGTVGLSTEHPEIVLSDYVSEAGMEAVDVMGTGCLDAVIASVLGAGEGFFTHDPRVTEPLLSIMLENDVGRVAAASPVLLVQGTADQFVAPARTDDLFERMCASGQVTEYLVVDGATHTDVTERAIGTIEPWLAARLEGAPPTDDCLARRADVVPPTTTATEPPVFSDDVAPGPTGTRGGATDATTPAPGRTRTVGDDRVGTRGELPRTGAPAIPLVALAAGLLGLGGTLTMMRRRLG